MVAMQQILFDIFVISFFVLGIAAVAAGVGLIVCRAKTLRLFAAMNRSVSTRKAFKPVAVPRDFEPVIRRHRLWFGIAFILGAVYSIYVLGLHFNMNAVVAAVDGTPTADMTRSPVSLFVEIARWTLLASSVLVLLVGIILSFTPNTLSAIEAYANRWISLRKATIGMEKEYRPVDDWVEAFPRTAGTVIALGALILVVSSGVLLFAG